MRNRVFYYPDKKSYVIFTQGALQHMYLHIQCRFRSKEAGGEIYSAAPFEHGLVISSATGPSPRDVRRRRFFNPDPDTLSNIRNQKYAAGEHVVGLWHTHPEATPSPSPRDRSTTVDFLNAFVGDQDRYILTILGNSQDPINMGVWVATLAERQWIKLEE